MASRRPVRNIRGPQSALTDFLASNNISAAQIRADYERRLAESARQISEEQEVAVNPSYTEHHEPQLQSNRRGENTKKRKRHQTVEKTKKSKKSARRKPRRAGQPDDDYEEEDEDPFADGMLNGRKAPPPGQLANCELCDKRFTVTAYSKSGPNGGLLCSDCSKKHSDGGKKAPVKKRGSGIGRRQYQSNLLDGLNPHGAQSLLEMCTKKVATNIDDVEEFGELPPSLLHRLSQILSRRRAINRQTLDLFLRPDHKELNIYDCAKLDTDDFHKILATMPRLTRLNLRFVTPMKDRVFEYMVDRDMTIQDLHLDSPNLVTDACWRRTFTQLGCHLQSIKLWNLDSAFDDQTVEVMCKNCPGLRRLKLKYLWKIGNGALEAVSTLKSLEHLSLHLMNETSPESLLHTVAELGPRLRSLSLEGFELADDRLPQFIHKYCGQLSKLRFTQNAVCTDKALTELFKDWSNPALSYVDFHGLRDVDMSNPDGPVEPVGLASNGFVALMNHSGSKIRTLNIASCRHISYSAYEEVFGEGKRYPELRYLDIAFNGVVDSYIAQRIFECCPVLTHIVVFGCFKFRNVQAPKSVTVIGTVHGEHN